MKHINPIICLMMLAGVSSCGSKTATAKNELDSVKEATAEPTSDYTDLINTVYDNFVFPIDANPDVYGHPEEYFTANALKKLSDSYEYDCPDGSCYAFYELRTQEHDSNPNAEDESRILSIEAAEDGWYVVSYLDMGWQGMTRLKILDGKIDDFLRWAADLN